jgi:hypothetical protein
VVPTLPALYRDGTLAVLPALSYPSSEAVRRHALVFAPGAGAVV